ncbi:MAG: phosphate signaling complex protein PhoU [Deltaproteobacteria bacterium]|jgi:phosphate transport system protein|nr:phosphate signaling complex protein PhoU [Deltaproteobacteria bacterium]
MPQRQADLSAKVGREVQQLRQLALRMAGLAEAILDKSLRSAWTRDGALAGDVTADDLEIDRLEIEIDQSVLNVLALQAPVASDLRQVLAIKTMANDLERVGDLARNIAGCAQRLGERAPIDPPAMLRSLAQDCQRTLSRAIQAFADLDTELARAVLAADDAIDATEDRVIRQAITQIHSEPSFSEQVIDLIFIAKSLERVADHATNIAEDVILAAESLNVKHEEKLAH